MTQEELQRRLDRHLPYFQVRATLKGWHLAYNGHPVLPEHWERFERFTAILGFPLDFSSSHYVGIEVSSEQMDQALRSLG